MGDKTWTVDAMHKEYVATFILNFAVQMGWLYPPLKESTLMCRDKSFRAETNRFDDGVYVIRSVRQP